MSLLKSTEIKYTHGQMASSVNSTRYLSRKKIYNGLTHLLPENRKQKQKLGNASNSVYVVSITLLPKLTKN